MTAVSTARPLAERPSPLTPRGTVWAALRLHRTPCGSGGPWSR